MVRLSALRNYPVILGDRPLGLFQGISLDAAQRQIEALIVACGFSGKRVVLPCDVRAVADGFILAERAQRYRRRYERPPCAFVRDTTGLLAGRVTDYAIDERALRVTAIELSPGYLPAERGKRLWMYAYARSEQREDELTVPASLLSVPYLCGEGMEGCAYLP